MCIHWIILKNEVVTVICLIILAVQPHQLYLHAGGFFVKGIILASHGQLAAGMMDTLKLFVGEPEQIEYLCLMPGQEMPEFLDKLTEAVSKVDCGDGVVVFCDLLFGTPCNCSAALLNNSQSTDKIDVITGMNLSMILEFVGSRSLGMGNESIISTGIEGIVDFKKLYQERMKQFDQ